MVTLWVVNASPVILLVQVGQLALLQHLGPPVVIPEAVVQDDRAAIRPGDRVLLIVENDPKFSRIPIALMIRDVNVKRSKPAAAAIPGAGQTSPAPNAAPKPAPVPAP